jgi:hypothetical protein
VARARHIAVAVAVAPALLVLVSIGCGGRGERVTEGGPLACPDCHDVSYMPMDVGKVGTYGGVNLQNTGKVPAVLERVEYVDRTPGLRLIGPFAARNAGIGLVREFPPRGLAGKLHPLHGYRVPPFHRIADDVDVLLGVSPLRRGTLSYRALRVYYRVGDRQYVATLDQRVLLCAPGSVPLETCRAASFK